MYKRHQINQDSTLALPRFKELCSDLVDQPLAHHETATVFASLIRRRHRRLAATSSVASSIALTEDGTLKFPEFDPCFLAIAQHGIVDVIEAYQQTTAEQGDDQVASWSCNKICQSLISDLARWKTVLQSNQVSGANLSDGLLISLGITDKLERDQIMRLHVDRNNPLYRYNSNQLRLLFEHRQLNPDFINHVKSLNLTGPQLLDMSYPELVALSNGNHNTASLLHQIPKTMHHRQVVVCREWKVTDSKIPVDKRSKYLQALIVGQQLELVDSKNSVHWWFGKQLADGACGLFPSTVVVHSPTSTLLSDYSLLCSSPTATASPGISEVPQPKVSIIEAIRSKNSIRDLLGMLVAGADPNVVDGEGRTPLHFGCRQNSTELCSLLLAYGTRTTTRDVRGYQCQRYLPTEAATEGNSPDSFSLHKMFFLLDNLRALIQIGHDGYDSIESFWKTAIFFELCTMLNTLEIGQRKIVLRIPGVVQFLLSCLGQPPNLDFDKCLPNQIGLKLQSEAAVDEVSDYPLARKHLPKSDHFDASSIVLKKQLAPSVFECEATINGVKTTVAAKALDIQANSMREATIFSVLRPFHHPHIVTFHGIAKIHIDGSGKINRTAPPNRSFLVMEKCEKTLKDIFDQEERNGASSASSSSSTASATWFTYENVMKVCECVLKALMFLTTTFPSALDLEVAAMIVHRDLKPSNILLRDGTAAQAVLADFGISRMSHGETKGAHTPTYCPPEYLFKTSKSPRELNDSYDIWCFGCLMFEMFARKPMLALKSNSEDLFNQHLARCYPQRDTGHQIPFPKPGHCPPKEWRAITACWAQRPVDRPSAGKLYQTLFGGDSATTGRACGPDLAADEERQLSQRFPVTAFPLFQAGLVVRVMPPSNPSFFAVVRVTLDLLPFIELVFEHEKRRWLARPPPSDSCPMLNDDHHRWLLSWARLMMPRCEQLRRRFPECDFAVNLSGSDDQQRMKWRMQSKTRIYFVDARTNQPQIVEESPDSAVSSVSVFFRFTELPASPGLTHVESLGNGLHLYCYPYSPTISASAISSAPAQSTHRGPAAPSTPTHQAGGPVCKNCFMTAPEPSLRWCVACGKPLDVSSVATKSSPAASSSPIPSSTRVVQHFFERDLETGSALSQKLLGKGAFGKVIKGTINRTGEDVAIKLFEVSEEQMSTLIDAIHKEAEIMSQLDHPNLVRFIGYMALPQVALVLEFMRNGDLFNYLHVTSKGVLRPLAKDMELRFMTEIASALVYLHNLSMVHRDLKSPNVLLDGELHCKLSDFGFAKHNQEEGLRRPRSVQPLSKTQLGQVGTDNYNAPEVLSRQTYDKPGDVYAMGVLFWEICSRQIPWDQLTSEEIEDRVVGQKERLPALTPSPIADLINRLTSWEASRRPEASEVLVALNSIVDQSKTMRPSPSGKTASSSSAAMRASIADLRSLPRPQSARPSARTFMSTNSLPRSDDWDLHTWLSTFGLERYAASIKEAQMDTKKLVKQLTLEDLRDLGVAEADHQELLQQISQL